MDKMKLSEEVLSEQVDDLIINTARLILKDKGVKNPNEKCPDKKAALKILAAA